jgi:hypothetical protein
VQGGGERLDEPGRVVAAIHRVEHAPLDPAECVGEERRARLPRLPGETGELVHLPARLEAEVPDPLLLAASERMDGEDPAPLHELVRQILVRSEDDQARPGGGDAGRREVGDEAAGEPPLVSSGDDAGRRVEAVEEGGNLTHV